MMIYPIGQKPVGFLYMLHNLQLLALSIIYPINKNVLTKFIL